jgi:hypothetical protein
MTIRISALLLTLVASVALSQSTQTTPVKLDRNAVVANAGVFHWSKNFNYGGIDETDGVTFAGQRAIRFTASSKGGGGGGWLPVIDRFFNTTGYKYLQLTLAPTRPGQSWQLVQPELPQHGVNDTPVPGGATVNVEDYGPAPEVGVFATYKIPLSVIAPNGTMLWKFGVQDQIFWANGQNAALGSGNQWYVADARFTTE